MVCKEGRWDAWESQAGSQISLANVGHCDCRTQVSVQNRDVNLGHLDVCLFSTSADVYQGEI